MVYVDMCLDMYKSVYIQSGAQTDGIKQIIFMEIETGDTCLARSRDMRLGMCRDTHLGMGVVHSHAIRIRICCVYNRYIGDSRISTNAPVVVLLQLRITHLPPTPPRPASFFDTFSASFFPLHWQF